MVVVLSSVLWQTVSVYLQNILIFLNSSEKHLDQVRKLLVLFRNEGKTLERKNVWL